MENNNKLFDHCLNGFRVLIAGILAAHGFSRFFADAVAPFGQFLDIQGFPFGFYIAAAITAIEIIGTPLFALGRYAATLGIVYAFIYFMGIILVHAPEGWFVVGLGRNGAEYSVLLIASLLLLVARHWHTDGLIKILTRRSAQ